MVITAEDALGLLRKWFDERTRVKALWVSADLLLTAKVTGFVNGLAQDGGIIIANDVSLSKEKPPIHFLQIDHTRCMAYEYMEAKDIKGYPPEVRDYLIATHGLSNLTIRFTDGSHLSIFEFQDSN